MKASRRIASCSYIAGWSSFYIVEDPVSHGRQVSCSTMEFQDMDLAFDPFFHVPTYRFAEYAPLETPLLAR